MPEIARVLAHGGSSPPDFTLHDAEHSFRVAEWMARLMPGGLLERLSEYEIALLLLSAYLHDIGMTPELDKVRRHRDFLLTGNTDLLTADEARDLQHWLDAAGYGAAGPCDRARPQDETVREADEIIAGYTRHRHNDWSEAWIRKRFEGEPLGTYEGWMADVIRLCRSHHEGYEALVGRQFDPRRVGSDARVVHLRYLAALLRVADVLDVDRERTPAVVFHHRDIASASRTYWEKDAELAIHLEDGHLSAAARPPRAYLHRAVEETLDGIDRELALCRRLAEVTRFEKPVGPGADLPHRWIVQGAVFRDVEPRDGAYEYIDGAFRPNTRRLLELLAGTALYGDRMSAVRELLQNAFDAVRELIAYRRLQMPDPSDSGLEAQIGGVMWVRLTMKQDGDRWWLVCRDDGAGMTRGIIRDALLVSGSPLRPEVLELDRRCRAAGFRLGRTGQFGIGALSYFMLADRVELTTRRASEAGSAEPNGWWFESNGVNSFGELRADTSRPHGTEVQMRLRSDQITDPDRFAARVPLYLRAMLVHIPCNLAFDAPFEAASFRLRPGWSMGEADRTEAALRNFHASGEETGFADPETARPEARRAIGRHERRWSAIRREAAETLRWEIEEGDLPRGMGRYRLHLPYFEVPGGVSLPFIRPRAKRGGLILRPVARGDFQRTGARSACGWRGIAVEVAFERPSRTPEELLSARPLRLISAESLLAPGDSVSEAWERYGVSAEVDFRSGVVGTLAVNRGWLELGPEGKKLVDWLGERARMLVENFVCLHRGSAFALLNARVANVTPPADCRYEWALSPAGPVAMVARRRALRWGPLPFPLTLPDWSLTLPPRPLLWKGQPVSYVLAMRAYDAEWSGQMIVWPKYDTPPQRLVVATGPGGALVPLWTGEPIAAPPRFSVGWTSELPPEWQHVCAFGERHDPGGLTWNRGNPVVLAAFSAPEKLRRSLGARRGSSAFDAATILETPATGAIWLLDMIARFTHSYSVQEEVETWDEVRRTAPDFLPHLWKLLLGSSARGNGRWQPIARLRGRLASLELLVLSPDGALIRHELPLPSSTEWVVSQTTS